MFLFFDRIYTGAPNITGHSSDNGTYRSNMSGAFSSAINRTLESNNYWGGQNLNLNASRISSEYSDINEVRVKSIISKGYIKLF